jgi:hypothetical protein
MARCQNKFAFFAYARGEVLSGFLLSMKRKEKQTPRAKALDFTRGLIHPFG